jgi:hypothetical protein
MIENLIDLGDQILKQQERIKEIEKKVGLDDERETLKILNQLYSEETEKVTKMYSFVFKPDKFTNGKYYVIKENGWDLLKKPKTTRILDTQAFIQAHPIEAMETCKIPLGEIDDKLGKNEVAKFCKEETTFSYELVKVTDRKDKRKKSDKPKVTDVTTMGPDELDLTDMEVGIVEK